MGEGKKLFVAKLPQDIEEDEIEYVFKTYGPVEEVVLMDASRSNRPDERCGFVIYKTVEAARTAVEVLNDVYRFREESAGAIHVSFAKSAKAKGDGKGKDKNYHDREPYAREEPSRETRAREPYGREAYGRESYGREPHGREPIGREPPGREPYGRESYRREPHGREQRREPYGGQHEASARPVYRGERVDRGSDRGPPREREYDNKYQPEGYRREHEAIRHRERDRDYPRPERGHGGYDDRRPDVATGRYERGGRNPDVYRPHGDDRAARDDRRGGQVGTKVYVGNLPTDITKEALTHVFRTYGSVEDVHIMVGRSKSGQASAFIKYFGSREASDAINAMAAGYEIRPGQGNIVVRLADGEGPKGGGRSRPY